MKLVLVKFVFHFGFFSFCILSTIIFKLYDNLFTHRGLHENCNFAKKKVKRPGKTAALIKL